MASSAVIDGVRARKKPPGSLWMRAPSRQRERCLTFTRDESPLPPGATYLRIRAGEDGERSARVLP